MLTVRHFKTLSKEFNSSKNHLNSKEKTLGKTEKSWEKSKNWKKPWEKPINWKKPWEKPINWKKPWEKPINWKKPWEKPINWKKPWEKPINWKKPWEKPKDFNTPWREQGKDKKFWLDRKPPYKKPFNPNRKKVWGGTLNILFKKSNIFCTLVDRLGTIRGYTSLGCLQVKGTKKRRAIYLVDNTVKAIFRKINPIINAEKKKLKLKRKDKLCYVYKAKGFIIKKKRIKIFKKFRKFRGLSFIQLRRTIPLSHNGCRPPKKRRK